MNKLSREKQEAVVAALVEGLSVRSVERLVGVHRDTILDLLVRIGTACESLMDSFMRDLPCGKLQLDELWAYVGKKQKRVKIGEDTNRVGDFYTFVALCPDTKIIASYRVGKRDGATCRAFVADLAERLSRRVQISTDAFSPYVEAIEQAFGDEVDYGTVIKTYAADPAVGRGRYSPPRVIKVDTNVVQGEPDPIFISTSLVERVNLEFRMNTRRFTRLTNAFSRKPENLRAAVALFVTHYNFCKRHGKLRTTPAMAAKVTDRFWTVSDLVGLID